MKPALDLERHGDDRAHAGAGEQRYGAGDGRQVLVHGGHPRAAVAPGAGLDGDAGEALAGGGEAGGGPHLQFGLVVGGEQQIGGVAVEHVAGALDRALKEAVEVVGGGGADEDLEGVRGLAALRHAAVGGRRAARGGLEHRALLGPYQQQDGGRLAGAVADPQVGAVDGQDTAVAAAQAVGALPAGELEGFGQADAGAGGLRPGGEVGQGLAEHGVGGVAEEVGGVVVPAGDPALAVDLDDGDPDPLVGQRQFRGRQDGAGGAGARGALGQVELEPDLLSGAGVLHAPAAGQGGAQQQAAPALVVGVAELAAAGLHGHFALGVVVGDLDPYRGVVAQTLHVGGGARVDHGVGDQLRW